MSRPSEMSARTVFGLAGEAFAVLLAGFCFLALAFCM